MPYESSSKSLRLPIVHLLVLLVVSVGCGGMSSPYHGGDGSVTDDGDLSTDGGRDTSLPDGDGDGDSDGDGDGDADGDGDVDGDADGDGDGDVDGDGDGDGDGDVFTVGWTRTFGGVDQEWPSKVAFGPDGAVFVTGTFRGTVDFDPSPAEELRTSGPQREMFVLKLSPSGRFLWVRVLGVGSARDAGVAMVITDDGSMILTGRFGDTVDLDPDPESTVEHESEGEQDLFVLCLDGDGDYRWARTFGGAGSDWGTGLAIGPTGSVVVAGRFWGTLDFDPDPEGVDLRGIPETWSMFVVSSDAATGENEWVSTFEGGGDIWGTGMATTPSGALMVSGRFEGIVDFDPDPEDEEEHMSMGERDIFVFSLDPMGRLIWARTYGQSGEDWATGIAVTRSGTILLSGYFEHFIGFDGPPSVDHDSNGYWDAFVLALDEEGERLWSTSFGGSGWDWAVGMAVADDGILVAGTWEERVHFNPMGEELLAAGGWDSYLLRLSRTGSFQWVRTWGARGWDYADDVAIADDSSMVIVGSFERNVDFDPCEGVDEHSSNGESDTYVTRLRENGCYR